jgi:hypothetical protein
MTARAPGRVVAALVLGAAMAMPATDGVAAPKRYLGVPPPLKALGRALERLNEGGAEAGSAARKPRSERKPAAVTKRGMPAAELTDAPLPRPRPPSEPSTEAAAPAEPPVVVAAKPPPLSAEARPPPVSESSAGTDGLARPPRPRPDTPGVAAIAATPPLPEPEARAGTPLEAANAFEAIDAFGRTPRARPDDASARLALVQPDAQLDADDPPLAPAAPALPEDETACLVRLEELGVVFTRQPAITDKGACNVANPIEVSGIGAGVTIAPAATLNCRTAEALALWARDVMLPAARKHLRAEPDRLVNASAYVCRPRNNQAGARLSEHATANAFDISAIGFADREPVAIESRDRAAPEGRFQASIREGSCRYFTTVLGPGSDAAHATHFHFDMAQRRGGYRLCELGDATKVAREAGKTKRE